MLDKSTRIKRAAMAHEDFVPLSLPRLSARFNVMPSGPWLDQ